MATGRKTTKKSPEGAQGSETMTELFNQMMDPGYLFELQRQTARAAFDGALEVHTETRKLTEQAWGHSCGELDAYLEPWRKAGQEMQAAGFDLGKRAIEVSRGEVDRWYEAISKAS